MALIYGNRGRYSKADWSICGRLRFMLNKIAINENGCWLWLGFVDPDTGYGQIRLKSGLMKVHRFMAYCALNFDYNQKFWITMHTCDRRDCINPDHLKIGTQNENLWDARKKGRWRNQYSRKPLVQDWGKNRKSVN